MLSGDVPVPVPAWAAGGGDGAGPGRGLGAGQAPAGAGDADPVLEEVAAGAGDDAGGGGQAIRRGLGWSGYGCLAADAPARPLAVRAVPARRAGAA